MSRKRSSSQPVTAVAQRKPNVPRWELFAFEYLQNGFNGQRAYLKYWPDSSLKAAGVSAHRLLANPKVRAIIEPGIDRLLQDAGVSSQRILQEYSRIAFGRMTDLASWDQHGVAFKPSTELTDDAAATVQAIKSKRRVHTTEDGETVTVELELKQHDKLDALEKLARVKKLLGERDGAADSNMRVVALIPVPLPVDEWISRFGQPVGQQPKQPGTDLTPIVAAANGSKLGDSNGTKSTRKKARAS